MRIQLAVLVISPFIALCWPTSILYEDPELISGYTEGDMIIDDLERNSVKQPLQKWPSCSIRYYIHCKDYESQHLVLLKRTFREITDICGLQFQQVYTQAQPLLNITCEANGCFAGVGYSIYGTRINLQKYPVGVGCFRNGTVGHELSHALGKYHEHARPDRDSFIKVAWQNIMTGMEGNFVKKLANDVDVHGLPYDYGSNMHYSAYGFSNNGQATIIPLSNAEIGQRRGFSALDKAKLKKLYPGCKK